MSFPCFLNLLHLIKPHPIFYNLSHNPQQDPSIQLAIAVCCLGSNGNEAAVYQLKNLFCVGYVTINLYTSRVVQVIYELRNCLASWPTPEERLELSQVMQTKGFQGCIGFVDGTTIPLSQKPTIDGNHYFDCKKRDELLNCSIILLGCGADNCLVIHTTDIKSLSLLFVMLTKSSSLILLAILGLSTIAMSS